MRTGAIETARAETVVFRQLAVLLLAASAAWAQADDFEKGLKKANSLVKRRRWEQGKKHLDRLLVDHKDQGYARARRAVIERLMKTFVFRTAWGVPDPKDLVSGELLFWSAATGKVKVRYTEDTMGDFKAGGDFLVHDASFAGPHAITVKGRSYPTGTGPQFLVCMTGEEHMLVIPGTPRMTPRVLYRRGKAEERVGTKEKSICTPGSKFRVRVQVGRGSVSAAFNNKAVVKGRKKPGLWGFVGFSKDLAFEEVLIEGMAEKAWIQGLIDKEDSKRLKAFDWRPDEHLPAWLFERTAPQTALAKPDGRVWPGRMTAQEAGLATRVMQHLSYAQFEEAIGVIERKPDAPRVLREYLRAVVYDSWGKTDEALRACRLVHEDDADFIPAFELEARILVAQKRIDQALEVYRALLDRYPGGGQIHAGVAMLLHKSGRSREARRLLEQAVGKGIASPQVDAVLSKLIKATEGPTWPRRYEHKSKHYHIITDIDKKTCYEAARLLEKSYTSYIVRLERVQDAEKRRFRVFLFSGEAGYTRYCKDLFGYSLSHSAGCYDPDLKQLLIWNAPQREIMMRTVRHEGFHQYLDRIMDSPPAWFNEGLAEYYETATVVRGKWQLGVHRPDHARSLGKIGLAPLNVFLFESHKEFMAQARRNYAQAWAFITFLRHGTREDEELFERFWEAFKRNNSRKAAVREALGRRDVNLLHARFAKWVSNLTLETAPPPR